PDIEMAKKVVKVLDQNAESAANAAHCNWKSNWITKSRPGLEDHMMAKTTYKNLEIAGPPQFNEESIKVAQEIQKNLGFEPMEKPFLDEIETLIDPEEAERKMRENLPSWQKNFTSDDYTEYCWHAPTVR